MAYSVAAKRRARALRRWTALVLLGACVALAGFYVLLDGPSYFDYYNGQGPGGEISIPKPWIKRVLFWLAIAGLGFSLLVSVAVCWFGGRTARVQAQRLKGIARAAGVFVGSPLAFWFAATAVPSALVLLVLPVVLLLNSFGETFSPPFSVLERATSPDGKEYAFLYFGVMQAQIMVLAQPDGEDAFRTVYRVLGENNGDWPRSWASVVRPQQPAGPRKLLYFGPKGLVLGIVGPNHCFLAYDAPSRTFWGHGAIEDLSPFVLLDKNTVVDTNDVGSTRDRIKSFHPAANGVPHKDVLMAGRSHPNPAVKKLAAEWLELWNEGSKLPRPDHFKLEE